MPSLPKSVIHFVGRIKLPSLIDRPKALTQFDDYWVGAFQAMASPCELLMATPDETVARELLNIAAAEAWRIEQKYSRYREDGIVPVINRSHGKPIAIDEETTRLLDYAFQCYTLSDGLFDITSGILRKIWRFDGSAKLPSQQAIDKLLPLIGLNFATWEPPYFSLPTGMEIDFGGIGKEYAVDRTLGLLATTADIPLLVNYGGDIAANRACAKDKPWVVGIENPTTNNSIAKNSSAKESLRLLSGGLATSGSTKRYFVKGGKRYSHVLNPKTGWPISNAPLSISVSAATCTEAGMLATFAMLQGDRAEKYLKSLSMNSEPMKSDPIKFWCYR
jgi:thiamine biosynthesis lipoprotein